MIKFNVFLASMLLMLTFKAFSMPWTRVIAFGDSLTDVGNNTWVMSEPKNGYSIIGAPVTNNIDNKRGKLWINYLLDEGYPEFFIYKNIMPVNSTNGSLIGYSIGYAWASAETMDGYGDDGGIKDKNCIIPGKYNDKICVPGLLKQIKLFLAKNKPDTKALYVIWAGGNDLFNNLVYIIEAMQEPKTNFTKLSEITLDSTDNILKAVKLLRTAGVPDNNIVVLNLPDITKAPTAQKFLNNKPVLTKIVESLVDLFNWNLKTKLAFYNTFKKNGVRLIDVNHLIDKIYNDPGVYGFVHLKEECVINPEALKNNCNGYLFYNGKHPTTQANAVLARFILSELKDHDNKIR